MMRDLSHVNIFCQFVNLLMAVFKCGLLHWPLFYAWLIPYASLCLEHTVMCSWYSTGTKIATGKSRISFVYIWHLSLREKKTAKYSMLLCTWRDRSFQTATKILGDFLKWHYFCLFWPGAKVHHYYYDLYAFVKNCAVPIDIIALV